MPDSTVYIGMCYSYSYWSCTIHTQGQRLDKSKNSRETIYKWVNAIRYVLWRSLRFSLTHFHDTLNQKGHDHHFADHNFTCIFSNQYFCILIKISPKSVRWSSKAIKPYHQISWRAITQTVHSRCIMSKFICYCFVWYVCGKNKIRNTRKYSRTNSLRILNDDYNLN